MKKTKLNSLKKPISAVLMLLILASLFTAAYASEETEFEEGYDEAEGAEYSYDYEYEEYSYDGDRFYEFVLSCGGEEYVTAQKGDVITVTLSIKSSGEETVTELPEEEAAEDASEEPPAEASPETAEEATGAELTAFQDEICYDDTVLELLPDTFTLSDGVEASDIQTDDSGRRIRVSYIIPKPDRAFGQNEQMLSVDFRVLDEVGEVCLTQENYFVTTDDGLDTYDSDANELVVNTEELAPAEDEEPDEAYSEEYTVYFEFNDEEYTGYEEQTVALGSTAQEPETIPVREGYVFAGWYTDSECTEPYDFTMPVEESLTLYAKWEEARPSWPIYVAAGVAVVAAAAVVFLVIKKKKNIKI